MNTTVLQEQWETQLLDDPVLTRDSKGIDYEATIYIPCRLRVPQDLLNRMLIGELRYNEGADLMNPETYAAITEKIGKGSFWLARLSNEDVHLDCLLPEGLARMLSLTLPQPQPREQYTPSRTPTLTSVEASPAAPVPQQKAPLDEKQAKAHQQAPHLPEELFKIQWQLGWETTDALYVALYTKAREFAPVLWPVDGKTPDTLGLLEPIPEGLGSKDGHKQGIYYRRTDQRKILRYLYKEWQDGRYQLTPEAAADQALREQDGREKFSTLLHTMQTATNGARLK